MADLRAQVGFPTDAEILAALKLPNSLSYVAAQLHTSMERVRGLRDKHKAEIVETRLKNGQTIEGICFQLDILPSLDRMREWHKRKQDEKQDVQPL